MNLRFQGSLTKDEFKNSIKLANRPVLKTSGFHFDLWVILLIAGIAMILIGLRLLFLAMNLSGGTLVAVIGAVLIGYAMKVRSAVDRAWESLPKEQLQREGSITDEHLELRAHTGISQHYWTGFTGYGEYENIVVLFQGPVAYPFSARFFQSEAEWDEFKRFLSGRLPVTHRVPAALINASNWLVWTLLLLSIAIMIFYIFLQENN